MYNVSIFFIQIDTTFIKWISLFNNDNYKICP